MKVFHDFDADQLDIEARTIVQEALSSRHDSVNEPNLRDLADAAERDLEAELQAKGVDIYQFRLWQAVVRELRRRGTSMVQAAA